MPERKWKEVHERNARMWLSEKFCYCPLQNSFHAKSEGSWQSLRSNKVQATTSLGLKGKEASISEASRMIMFCGDFLEFCLREIPFHAEIIIIIIIIIINNNSVALVHERILPPERPLLRIVCHVVSVTDPLRPYSGFSRPEPVLFLPSSISIILKWLMNGPRSRPTTSQKMW
jgi:hypothetical protein